MAPENRRSSRTPAKAASGDAAAVALTNGAGAAKSGRPARNGASVVKTAAGNAAPAALTNGAGAAKRGRTAPNATPATNGTAAKTTKIAGPAKTGRAKKADANAHEPAAASRATNKRKNSTDTEDEKSTKKRKKSAETDEEKSASKRTKAAVTTKAETTTKAKPAIQRKHTKSKSVETEASKSTSRRSKSKSVETDNTSKSKTSNKRKTHTETDDEAAPKAKMAKESKPRVTKPKEEKKPLPKGPRRIRGIKTEINAIRYTEPLKVFVFGEGGNGELGLGAHKKAKDVKRPRFNEPLSNMNVVKIATGGMHVVALTSDNKILTWGVNDNGALGRETTVATVPMREADADSDSDEDDDPTGGLNETEATPTAISAEYFPPNTVFVDVAAGDSCSYALTTEGALYGWGTFRQNEGVLGFTRQVNTARTPIYIEDVTKVTDIVCGTNHVLALDKDKKVWAWGSGQQSQLGRRAVDRILGEGLLPNRVGFHDPSIKRASQRIVKLASGDYHSIAIADDGHVWGWGANNYAEAGQPDTETTEEGIQLVSVPQPRIIHSLENRQVVSIEGGAHHNVAVTANGECLAWGRCDGSQVGIPMSQLDAITDSKDLLRNSADKPKILTAPTRIPNLDDIVTAACGPDHTIAINKDGKAFSWGFSTNYQCGQGTEDDIDVPTLIDNTAVRDIKLTYAGAGGQYSVLASKL